MKKDKDRDRKRERESESDRDVAGSRTDLGRPGNA